VLRLKQRVQKIGSNMQISCLIYPYAIFLLLGAGFFTVSGCDNDATTDEVETGLVWSDEFSGPNDQSPEATKWTYDIGTDWGNNQLEYSTTSPKNASLDGNGNLRIRALKEDFQGQSYTSARIVTRDRIEPTYGRIEARIDLPTGQGIWPAFWLLGSNISTVGWPQSGEIDVMEFLGHDTDAIYGTLHGPGYFGGNGLSQKYQLSTGRFDTGFHIYAVEWTSEQITWFVDGIEYHSVLKDDVPGEWVFDHPFYIILNVAVGGDWPGSPDASTQFPQEMLVDYVRIYSEISPVTS
jgi:beta-glucanase (GH16 family)